MELKTISNILANCEAGTLILALLVGLFLYKRLDLLRKFIVSYLVLMLVTEALAYFVGTTYGSNHMIFPLYSLLELSFFFYMFKKYLYKKRHIATVVLGILGILYILYEFTYNFIYHQVSSQEYQPYAKVVDNFVIIVFSLTYMLEKMTTYNESRWDNFSLNIGLLINFTLSTIFFLPFNFLVNEKSGLKFYFWMCNAVLICFFYIFLVIEMYKNARKNRRLV